MRCFLRHIVAAAAVAATLLAGAAAAGPDDASNAQGRSKVVVLTLDDAIGPATAGYLIDGIKKAADNDAHLVVVRLNTPGGLSRSMRDIIDAILKSPVPVATYVAPRGARAASAGTYMLYASHVAAMAPGTTVGAATPIKMGGSPMPGGGGKPDKSPDGGGSGSNQDKSAPSNASAKRAKAVNDAVAYIRALAELRGRNASWGEKAVRRAATLTASAAADKNVADVVADNVPALLDTLDGRTVEVGDREVTLATKDARVVEAPMTWRDKLLATITDPNVAFIFMMIGIYGLIFELSNPGAILPGVLGAICLMIGLYALNVLPVSLAGLALLVLGIGFMLGEAFAPSFGALGLGGLVAFALGATMLFETRSPQFALSYWTIGGVTATTGLILVLLIGYLVRAQRRPVASGAPAVVGQTATVDSWSDGSGRVVLAGEYWNARGPAGLTPGQPVRVTDTEGLTLVVDVDDGGDLQPASA